MMKKHHLQILFLFLPMVFSCCYGQKGSDISRIEGFIEGLGNNKLILADDLYVPIDTVKAVNGRFLFKHRMGITDRSKIYMIYLPFINKVIGDPADDGKPHKINGQKLKYKINSVIAGRFNSGKADKAYFFIDRKKITVKGKITDNGLVDVTVKGSPLTDQYNVLEAGFRINPEIGKNAKLFHRLKREFMSALTTDKIIAGLDDKIDKGLHYKKTLDSLYGIRNREIIELVPSHKRSKALACIAYQAFTASGKSSLTMLKEALSKFSPELKNSRYIRLLRDKLKEWEVGAKGAYASDFVLKDSAGRATKLSSLRGNYVLLDFWASWCGPCRETIPDMIKAYHRFSGKGLKILGISTDNSKSKWLGALKEEKMPYTQLLDDQKITQKLYRYSGIPYYVLIDPKGRIKRVAVGSEEGKKLLKDLKTFFPE